MEIKTKYLVGGMVELADGQLNYEEKDGRLVLPLDLKPMKIGYYNGGGSPIIGEDHNKQIFLYFPGCGEVIRPMVTIPNGRDSIAIFEQNGNVLVGVMPYYWWQGGAITADEFSRSVFQQEYSLRPELEGLDWLARMVEYGNHGHGYYTKEDAQQARKGLKRMAEAS